MTEIIFDSDKTKPSEIVACYTAEAEALKEAGFIVGTESSDKATERICRKCSIHCRENYPHERKYINDWGNYISTALMSKYLPLISDISIPTFFTDRLDDSIIEHIQEHGWNRVFIKNDVKSLFRFGQFASVWPDTSFGQMRKMFAEMPSFNDIFAVRQYVDIEKMYEEERYWVLNHHPYSRTGIVPDIVQEAAKKLEPLGSRYYTIDAIKDCIIEVNPGECSDRGGDNTPEMIAEWFKKEFID